MLRDEMNLIGLLDMLSKGDLGALSGYLILGIQR